jgi:hypothetical protein
MGEEGPALEGWAFASHLSGYNVYYIGMQG